MLLVKWQGRTGKVIQENIGRMLVQFDDDQRPRWLLKGIGEVVYEHKSPGRPAKHEDQAAKQRAYRERKKGNALRKYSKSDNAGQQE